ncbi:MAG: 4Fe-4S dicluster domain-containing protein [bacterium]
MTATWYPIIDYDLCTSCFECVKFCPHNVFEIVDGRPITVNPLNCVEFCRGCQKGACDYDAISFPGDKKVVKEVKNG